MFVRDFVNKLVAKLTGILKVIGVQYSMSKITQIIDKYISQENYYFINRVYKQAMEKSSKEKGRNS